MTDGTSGQGKRNTTTHVICRRCGEKSYHVKKGRCSACGFGESSSRRDYEWQSKVDE